MWVSCEWTCGCMVVVWVVRVSYEWACGGYGGYGMHVERMWAVQVSFKEGAAALWWFGLCGWAVSEVWLHGGSVGCVGELWVSVWWHSSGVGCAGEFWVRCGFMVVVWAMRMSYEWGAVAWWWCGLYGWAMSERGYMVVVWVVWVSYEKWTVEEVERKMGLVGIERWRYGYGGGMSS